MSNDRIRLGIDVGAVFVKVAVLDDGGKAIHRIARRHRGNPAKVVREELLALGADQPLALGVTGVNAGLVAGGLNLLPVDFVQAEIKAVKKMFPRVRNVINVGGGSVTLIQLNEQGQFLDYSTNSLCAAGTGSFLDQQADRLGISYEEMERFPHHDDPPSIATRCSVFAKTDLIHRQQEGYGKAALWCGLCRGMTGTFLNTLLRGRPLKGLTVVTGGVSQNREVMRWLKSRYGDQVQTFEDAPFSGAIGAAHLTNGRVDDLGATLGSIRDVGPKAANGLRQRPLQFRKSTYPCFEVAESYVDEDDNEVRITRWPQSAAMRAYMGIDVGSTSTKALLMDEEEQVVADVYRKTGGDPIQATRFLFEAISEICRRKDSTLTILGAGTTGSGRKLVGQVIGADLVVNEITAHLTGALHVDSSVETVFEIGGQDSKYTRAKNGHIVDSNMNYVCAAGTGSFIEEQAKKLGFGLSEIGDVVMGLSPPVTSDRCTVFMEQDVDRLIRAGYTREECIAAVLCSVVKNYFTKVVGQRPYSRRKIFFLGATARNKGLVAAFENLLDVEMVVSPYCHVMGSYGLALLAKKQMEETAAASRFKGLDLSKRKITLRTETCSLCQNHCKITFAEIAGETEQPSWGYMCGRDPGDTRMRVRHEFEPFRKRVNMVFAKPRSRGAGDAGRKPRSATKTVGIPRALSTYSQFPLWRRFLEELGCSVALSRRTDDAIVKKGAELTAADFCFPVKIAHGHVYELAQQEGVDFVLLPHLISPHHNRHTTSTYFCPYVEAVPSVVKSTLSLHGVDADRILSPVVDFDVPTRWTVRSLHDHLGEKLGVTYARIRRAWQHAISEQNAFEARRREEGKRLIAELERDGKRAIVLVGRPYNVLDLGANLGLPQKIAELGLPVIPLDMLPYDLERINPVFRNMYWAYGQEILCAAEFIRRHPYLFPIYFTNFACGPDSFLLTFFEEVMGDKPFLTLELDEHGGDAGYMTRVEAFFDVSRSWEGEDPGPYRMEQPEETKDTFKGRRLLIPPMHPISKRLFASAFRREGQPAEALPDEQREEFEVGRALTRGSECLPCAMTTGALVSRLRRSDEGSGKYAFFMATATGPCRFGQYPGHEPAYAQECLACHPRRRRPLQVRVQGAAVRGEPGRDGRASGAMRPANGTSHRDRRRHDRDVAPVRARIRPGAHGCPRVQAPGGRGRRDLRALQSILERLCGAPHRAVGGRGVAHAHQRVDRVHRPCAPVGGGPPLAEPRGQGGRVAQEPFPDRVRTEMVRVRGRTAVRPPRTTH